MLTKFIRSAALVLALSLTANVAMASAETYQIDTKGAHAFIQFKIKHLDIHGCLVVLILSTAHSNWMRKTLKQQKLM